MDRHERILGCLLGTAVGDALGLPREGLAPGRARALFGEAPLEQCFLFGRGMMSDDTEHTTLVAQALLREPDNADRFARRLAWGLRGWFAGLPAGVGFATLRACLKLWVGFPPAWSGVWSAGNGPAMRAAILGACVDEQHLRDFVRASTRLTHRDPKAERGAMLVALAARHGPEAFVARAKAATTEDATLVELLEQIDSHLQRQASVKDFARALGLERGVSGYVYHTVPVALYAWLRWPDSFRQAVEEVILLGGDTDTTAAIVGGMAGATLGSRAIPPTWLRLFEYPRSISWLRELARRLSLTFPAEGVAAQRPGPARLVWPALVPRNAFFLCVVLGHIVRRLFPPYRA